MLGLLLQFLLQPCSCSRDARTLLLARKLQGARRLVGVHETTLRLRGGNYMEDVEPLEYGLTEREIEQLHYDIGKDGSTFPQPPDYSRHVGNLSIFDEDGALEEQGATDGFPFDWTQWRLDARFHVGFRAPLNIKLNHSIYAAFDEGELAVVTRSDGSKRFAQVLKRKSEGYFRGEMQVGHQYSVLLEPAAAPGTLPQGKILDSEDIGKLLAGWVPGHDALDAACRVEAAARLRELGNLALKRSLFEEASRKYVKALAYLDALNLAQAEDDKLGILDEWIKVRLNLALLHLRSQQVLSLLALLVQKYKH